jgi:hypothetical protein
MAFLVRSTSRSATAGPRPISAISTRGFGVFGARLTKESDLGESCE